MPVPLPDAAKAVLDSPEFATIATVEPTGQPHLSVVWVARDGDDVLVSTVKGRRKHRNLERDPRASLLVLLRDDPYRYLEVRGSVTMVDEGGPELIQRLSHKYRGQPYTADVGTGNVRVVVRLTPHKVVVRGG